MAVLGNLGGGFGEKPVRVSDLEAAARAERAHAGAREDEEKVPTQRERGRR
jgi:hypothetical protein